MNATVAVTMLVLSQSGWTFETAPLVAEGFTPTEAQALTQSWVLAIGAVDGGKTESLFAARPDGGLLTLGTWPRVSFLDGTGTGLTLVTPADAGVEVFRVRAQPTPTLVSLGAFSKEPAAVSCDTSVRECVVLPAGEESMLWRAGTRSRLFTETEAAMGEANLWVEGAAMAPDGGWVGLTLGQNAALYELRIGKVTLFRGNVTHTAKSVTDLLVAVTRPPLQKKLERAAEYCTTHPTGWNEGRLEVDQLSSVEVEGPVCKFPPFTVDPRTLIRQPLKTEPYPWDVFDCPHGGWGSSTGTLLTTCADSIQAMLRPLRLDRSSAPVDPDDTGELAEAVALSETELFILAPARSSSWEWFRRRPRFDANGVLLDKGIATELLGPSVVTFGSKGVTVEALPWPWGKAIFEASLDDDWHLVKPTRHPPVLVRFKRR